MLYLELCKNYKFSIEYSASVTAVFELGDGNEKSFMRSVQGSSSEHRINNNVSFATGLFFGCIT